MSFPLFMWELNNSSRVPSAKQDQLCELEWDELLGRRRDAATEDGRRRRRRDAAVIRTETTDFRVLIRAVHPFTMKILWGVR